LQLPFPCKIAVDEIRDACVCEKTKCPGMLVVNQEICSSGRRD
jgi:hypothetical protein